ncbi:efflux transporter, RND family, MFP subunit [Oryzomicrobium terrae]|uniref:Efflux transporter, RND family, MFP subunit n=1 Tax=Oryzomicrobium terrae TaxID=1735038 RepID=A0A5C1ECA5_9RHOO|nr:efflux RND transporter periplasmic adaptor subunit [Oryzomicrobium terrae]QEL66285.1 efflux transporter, RND family, MFP subunit [Oryzomicrobium terrae]
MHTFRDFSFRPARAALCLLPALLLAACGPAPETSAPPLPVLVAQARPAPDGGQVFSGEVRARREADLAFRIAGKLAVRLVDPGTRVKPGEVLARLDPEDVRLSAAASRAQQAQAEADLKLARVDLERTRALRSQNFISQAALDQKQAAYDAAAARSEAARAQATVAGNQSGYATLTADVAGVVTQYFAEQGQVVSAGQPVLRLAPDGEKEVVIAAGESQVGAFKIGQPVKVSLWARPLPLIDGVVREIAPAGESASRAFVVKVTLRPATKGEDEAVRLGMTATVVAGNGATAQSGVVLVPPGGLVQAAGKPVVWVLAGAPAGPVKAEARPVTVAQYREDGVLVSGVAAGEWVVSRGGHKLQPGQLVRAESLPGEAPPALSAAAASAGGAK